MAPQLPPLPADTPTDDDSGGPIGVPDNYTVTQPNRVGMTADALSRTHTAAPLYWSGAEWTTVRDLTSEDRGSLQLLLKQLGFIDAKTPLVLGQWDQRSATAFRQVLAWANVNGTDWRTALGAMVQSNQQFPQDIEAATEPLVARVSNPDDIRRAIKDGFRSRVGSGLIDDDDLDRMVAAYQQKELATQQAAYNLDETGGTVVDAPSIDSFVDTEAQKADPVAYDSYKVLDKFSTMLDTLGGSGAVAA